MKPKDGKNNSWSIPHGGACGLVTPRLHKHSAPLSWAQSLTIYKTPEYYKRRCFLMLRWKEPPSMQWEKQWCGPWMCWVTHLPSLNSITLICKWKSMVQRIPELPSSPNSLTFHQFLQIRTWLWADWLYFWAIWTLDHCKSLARKITKLMNENEIESKKGILCRYLKHCLSGL